MNKNPSVYDVFKLAQPLEIDGNWEKTQWQQSKVVQINNYMGTIPASLPFVEAKMMYNDKNLYVIFRVKEHFAHCVTKDINGAVWKDSCVECFFSPDKNLPDRYFNLEINCGGTPLMYYNTIPYKKIDILAVEDIKKIEIAHTLPQIVDPEIPEETIWTIEYRIPLSMLEKYSNISHPKPGVKWHANFYKIAENNSNPHYMTWSAVKNDKPDFHMPQFFGILIFQ